MIGFDAGRLPSNWRLTPLDSIADIIISNVDKKEHDGQLPVALCNYTDVYYHDHILDRDDYMPSTASNDQVTRFTVQGGDVAITKDSETADDIGRPSYAPEDIRGVVYGYHLAIYRPFDKRYGPLIRYLFDSRPVRAELHVRTPGVTRVGLSLDTLRNLKVPLPSPEMATRIADYLDHETAEIDTFISDQAKFSELLSERDITTMAMVRGLNSHSAPLRRFGSITLGKMIPSTRANEAGHPGLVMQPYLRAASVQPQGLLVLDENIKEMSFTTAEARNLTLHRNDVVVVEGGAGFGRSAVLNQDLPGWGFQNSINRIRIFPDVADPYFIHYNLQLMLALGELDIIVNQATIPHLTAEKLALCPIACRPLEQQKQISRSIRSELDRNNAFRADIQASIALARERRAALITAAVTGQIDVTARNKPAAEQLEEDIAQLR